MISLSTHPAPADNRKCELATNEDFSSRFTGDVKSLYLLSFLLTADHLKAEQCFVAGLNDCVRGNAAFKEWADSWARRVIVGNAVWMIKPRSGNAAPKMRAFHLAGVASQDARFAGVLALEDFERFVFVLTVLEGYPDEGCAVLLGVSQQEIREARVRALEHTADFDTEGAMPLVGLNSPRLKEKEYQHEGRP